MMATIQGTSGDDTLIGTDSRAQGEGDRLEGLAGDDYLDGGEGIDTLVGGTGNDVYIVGLGAHYRIDNFDWQYYYTGEAPDTVEENGGGTDEIRSSIKELNLHGIRIGFVRFSAPEVENLTGTSDSGQTLTGNALANIIKGGAGDDTLSGGNRGVDTLIGGLGNDKYVFSRDGGQIIELADGGIDHVEVRTVTFIIPDHVENATAQNLSVSRNITGNGDDNTIITGDYADYLDGGMGDDLLIGGLGDDIYVVEDDGDVVSDTGGVDTVRATVTFTLTSNIENLTLIGSFDASGYGNAEANVLTGNGFNNEMFGYGGNDVISGGEGDDHLRGNDGDDQIAGGTGADEIHGGNGSDTIGGGSGANRLNGNGGFDTVAYDSAAAGVRVDLRIRSAQDTGSGLDVINGFEGISGSRFRDFLNGDESDNVIEGKDGDDQLDGGSGDDRIDGGDGIDTAVYAYANAAVLIDLRREVQADNASGSDTLVSIEGVIGSEFADKIIGNEGDNRLNGAESNDRIVALGGTDVLLGGIGDDYLDGGEGSDRMVGGGGDDLYRVDDATDIIQERDGEGVDRVIATADYSISDHVEYLRLVGAARNGFGSDLANEIRGSAGTNNLNGRGGEDVIRAGSGNDIARGGAGDDRLYGQAGRDQLFGDDGEDILLGGAGEDSLSGGISNDVLLGGTGRDSLTGGGGADWFRFTNSDISDSADEADMITDFSGYHGDRIDLQRVDADTLTARNDAFTFVGDAAFSGAAGELRVEVVDSNTFLQGDRDGDGAADFFIRVDGLPPLEASDFIL
ncbi:calcium-binding protein [Enterovirga sp. GCM10030262]|uniref:calcium-binding protein n=1 Tax=Enterovirga sp. GCM10030262 TaxID=3273391 RepID=UPI0036221007